MDTKTVQVRTRIAPSPTGYPHVGTIYQALFDYAFAKKHNGEFIVRIEDTDRERFVEDAEDKIFNSLDWVKISENESSRKGGDFGPYRQSERLSIYKTYYEELIKIGGAYYCFCTKERLDEVRNKQQKEKKPIMYDRFCRNLTKTEIEKLIKTQPFVIRLKVPENKDFVVKDEIRGNVHFNLSLIDDAVLIKSDGFPTYHFASVVDDHLMKITHVVRAEEWISSLPKHIILYDYFNWEIPLFFHTPLLRNPDKSKLSKRHGHTSIHWYQEHGFLPDVILNFLALMGWSHPEEKEIFSLDEFVKLFELNKLKPVGPIFDLKKLEWMNGEYIRSTNTNQLKVLLLDYLKSIGKVDLYKKFNEEQFIAIIELAKSRINTLEEFYLITKHFVEYSKSQETSLNNQDIVNELIKELENIKEWNKDIIFSSFKNVMNKYSIKMPILYAIFTGDKRGLPLPESLEILGKENTLFRLRSIHE